MRISAGVQTCALPISLGKMQPLHRFLPALAAAAALALPVIAPAATSSAFAQDQKVHRTHAIAMHGEPKYGTDVPYFDSVNPNAPKGGTRTEERRLGEEWGRTGRTRGARYQ